MVLYGLAEALGSKGAALLVPESKERPCSAVDAARPFTCVYGALYAAWL